MRVFITGGTGYIGRHLVQALVARNHDVRALLRPGSFARLPEGCEPVAGDALSAETFKARISPAHTFVQLIGVAHPSPAKGKAFQDIDGVSIRESVRAAVEARIEHFIYVSVAQPAPVMKAFQAVRAEGERLIRASGLNATVLRPWYVLGPGHWWPAALLPLYWVFERIPSKKDSAARLGLITWREMTAALVHAVENPGQGVRIWDVPSIRRAAQQPALKG